MIKNTAFHSSPKPKHQKMKSKRDLLKIVVDDKLIGVLNFNSMIPVDECLLKQVDMNVHKTDSASVKHYKGMVKKQLDWCQHNQEQIINKANKLYALVTERPDDQRDLTRRCCDFKKLEQVLEKYLGKKRIEDGYLIEIKSPEQLTALKASGIPFQKAETSDGTIIVKVRQEDKDAAKNTVRNVHGKKL